MAKRSSSKKKSRTKRGNKNNPELRTGGGRQARRERAARRDAQERAGDSGVPKLPVRPRGFGGVLWWLLLGLIALAILLIAARERTLWGGLSYPASLWLYVGIAFASVAPAMGRIARSSGDTDGWGAAALLIPLGLFVAESVAGPACPPAGSCSVVGARGSLGIAGSLIVIAGLAAIAWSLAGWMERSASDRRPSSGRGSYSKSAMRAAFYFIVASFPLAVLFVVVDTFLRDQPAQVDYAKTNVARYCFDIGATVPDFDVRPATEGLRTTWASYLVRVEDIKRPDVGGKKLSDNWLDRDTAHPYEAVIVLDGNDRITLDCRKVSPSTGNAKKSDLRPDKAANETNPIDPLRGEFAKRFLTEGPSEEPEGEQSGANAGGPNAQANAGPAAPAAP